MKESHSRECRNCHDFDAMDPEKQSETARDRHAKAKAARTDCIDCHFVQDVHGNGKLYGEVRAAMEIQCIDCHGTISQPPTLRTSGPAASANGRPGWNGAEPPALPPEELVESGPPGP